MWSWKEFLASLPPKQYDDMFEEQDIVSFVCRALPFKSPYPATAKLPHWEFTATRADGLKVGIHPPGKKGQVAWTVATDEERTAALAAVKKKGLSANIRACYDSPPPAMHQPASHLHLTQPTTLQGGHSHAAVALVAAVDGEVGEHRAAAQAALAAARAAGAAGEMRAKGTARSVPGDRQR